MLETLRSSLTRASLAILLVAAFVGASAQASERIGGHDRYRQFGRVIDVRPVYREVAVNVPRLECRTGYPRRPGTYHRPYGTRDDRPHRRPRGDDWRYRGDRVEAGRISSFGVRDHAVRDHDGDGGAVIGGLLGGVVGNRLGRDAGRGGRVGATVAGAVIGSVVGRDIDRGGERGYRPHRRADGHRDRYRDPRVERCRESVDTRYETRLDYYHVTYVFRGRTFHARRDRDPGDRIAIDVSRSPGRR